MTSFDPTTAASIIDAHEIELTTFGRKTGTPSRRITWVYGGDGRVFIRSGDGFTRDWPKNLLANGRAIIHVGEVDIPVRAVHVTDLALSRWAGAFAQEKYGAEYINVTAEGEEPYPGETTTFEFVPAGE